MYLQSLPPVGVRLAERHPVGQGFEVSAVEMDRNKARSSRAEPGSAGQQDVS
ncbi:MAG: hypothetical protein ACLQFR_21960 [Streptosporangiaceae bacterium]